MSETVPERIETERLLLRRFGEADRPDMVRFYGDAEVMAIRKYGARDPQAASAAFDVLVEHWRRHGFGLYAVIERESGAFCGECGLRYTDDGAEVEISYGLFPPFRGKGYATEAAQAIRNIALNVLELPVLVARSRGDNRGSHAVLEKLGMTFAGRRESPGHPHGVVTYVIDRNSGS
ncbi:GNAT family N-acetyltransferase [Nisaea sp.]|uniref:GNAT family N-acetyltransferase n=1 Tax=Nisaea sp. TaxID=2024842 RepID=UPI0032EFEC67